MSRITHIVAMADNRVIGRDGGMPWHIPEDFKFFKKTTMGRALVMGRKTYASIGRALPGRLNVVVTRDAAFHADGVVAQPSLDAALAYCRAHSAEWGEEIFVIGGGEIYRQTLAAAERIYLTQVHRTVDGDTTYPALDLTAFVVTPIGGGDSPEPYTMLRLDRRQSGGSGSERAAGDVGP